MCDDSSCSHGTVTAEVEHPADGRRYAVKGMTCDHCATSVSEEVEKVAGVDGIDVDIATGRLTVRGDGFVDADVRRAVDEAGYEVVSA